MNDDRPPAKTPQPSFKWLAWAIVGMAGLAAMGGLTWRDAPAVLTKALLLAALCTAAVVIAQLIVSRPWRRG